MNIVEIQNAIKKSRAFEKSKFISKPSKKKGLGFYEDEKEDVIWENYIRNVDLNKIYKIKIKS